MDLTAVLVSLFGMLKVPSILFMCLVAPMWIAAHYRSRRRDAAQLSREEQNALEALTRVAERMEQRIVALEKILDAELPQWKEKLKDGVR